MKAIGRVRTRARTILLLGVVAAFVWASASGARAICEIRTEDCSSGGGPSTDDLWWLPSSPGVWSYNFNWALHSIGSNTSGVPTNPELNFLGYYLHFGYAAGAANTDSTDDIASLQVDGLDFGSGTNTVTIPIGKSLTVTPAVQSGVPSPTSYIQVASGGSTYIDIQGALTVNLNNSATGVDIGVNTGGTFTVNSNISIGSLQGDSTGSVNMNANLTVGSTNLSTTFGGSINGAGSLTKVGTGTLELTGDSGYSGTTTVNGGTLLVNNVTGSGTGGGDVGVNSGATIGGTGNVGNLNINFGGTLAPGNSPGVFSVGGHLNLAGTLAIQLGGTAPGQYDQVVVGFGATLSNPTLTLSLVNSFTPTFGEQFVIVQNNSPTPFMYPITGGFSNGSTVMDGQGNSYAIVVLPTEIFLTDITAVPEPATWLLLGVGAAGSVVGRLRRRR